MNDKEALDDIAEALRLYEWDTELTMAIAEIVRSTKQRMAEALDEALRKDVKGRNRE